MKNWFYSTTNEVVDIDNLINGESIIKELKNAKLSKTM